MIFGNKKDVALEVSIEHVIGRWIHGRFLLWLDGNVMGNRDDSAVDLKGCFNWLSDLFVAPRDRSAPELIGAAKRDVWRKIVDPVFEPREDESYPDAFSRFHIGQFGKS